MMHRRISVAAVLTLGTSLLLSGWFHAQAQAPGAPGGPPMPGAPMGAPGAPGAPGAATGGGTVTNTTTETTTTDVLATDSTDAEGLPDTGGAPLAMSLLGTLTAGGAFLLRRKIS